MTELQLELKVFKIVDEIDQRLTIARNTGADMYEVKSELRDELVKLINPAPK